MIDGPVRSELLAGFPIDTAFVGAQMRGFVDASLKDWTQVRSIDFWHMPRADTALALDERDNGFLWSRRFVGTVPSFPADEGFICFNEGALAAQWADRVVILHGLADTMPNEPASFEIDAESPAELVRAESFLRRAHQMHCLQPNVHRNMALFEEGADLDGKGLPAGVAFIYADPGALAFEFAAFTYHAAMRANAPIRPYERFDVGVSGLFIPETGLVENRMWHCSSPYQRIIMPNPGTSSPILPGTARLGLAAGKAHRRRTGAVVGLDVDETDHALLDLAPGTLQGRADVLGLLDVFAARRQMTCALGLAALAPTANGSPTPIVPKGPELSRWPGTKVGIDWRPKFKISCPSTERIASRCIKFLISSHSLSGWMSPSVG